MNDLADQPVDSGENYYWAGDLRPKLAAALVEAQKAMPAVEKTGKSNFGAHVTLDHLIAKTRQHLAENGLSILQFPARLDTGAPALRTILLHTSGESISADMPLLLDGKHTMQALGAAITYARRQGWSSVLGISTEADDDADGISLPEKKGGNEPAAKSAGTTHQAAPDASTTSGAAPPDEGTFFPPAPVQGFDVPAGDRTEAQAKLLHAVLPKLVKAGALTDEGFIAMARDKGATGDGVNACIDTLGKVGASALISRLKDIEKQLVTA